MPLGNGGVGIYANAGGVDISYNTVSANASHGIDIAGSSAVVSHNAIGLNPLALGSLGNGGAGVHSGTASGAINGNWVAHNGYGLWIEGQQPFFLTWSGNSIFENDGGLGIVESNPPVIPPGSFPVITSVVPNATTTTIAGFFDVPVGAFVPTLVNLEFFSSPACSKKRPRDFDEGKTSIGGLFGHAFSPHFTFSVDVPVVITDEVISPASGSPAGGDAITISGSNFAAGATVTIGGQAVGGLNVVNGGEIDATTRPCRPAPSTTWSSRTSTAATAPSLWRFFPTSSTSRPRTYSTTPSARS